MNIVRGSLDATGAEYVVDSSLPSFEEDILTTVKASRLTVAFDATDGGALAMEHAGQLDT